MRPVESREGVLEAYLHEHIPISAAMGVTVLLADPDSVRLRAPLEPNLNHRSTVFGGSAAAIATLAGWCLLHVRLSSEGHGSRIVIQKAMVSYDHPIDGDFEATARLPESVVWRRFVTTLERKGRARVELAVDMTLKGTRVGRFQGTYVVLPIDAEPPARADGTGDRASPIEATEEVL